MVIKKIKSYLEERRRQKEEERQEEERLENYRESEDMKKAEQIKKEADRLAHLKQYKTAIDEYNKALDIYPFNKEEVAFRKPAEFFFKIYFNVAASYSFLNKFKDAIDYFDKALQIDNMDNENKVKALMSKGNCYYRGKQLLQGGYESAYSIKMESDFEVDDKTLETLRRLDEKENLLKLTHDCFTKAIEADKNNAEAWYKKGHMEFLMGMVKESMLSFDNVLMINKKFENKEGISLFDDIKREKGVEVKYTNMPDSELKFKTKTGHLVRNKEEMMVANLLFENHILFQYDIAVTWADKDNFKANFFLPKLDLYIEHFKYGHIKDYQKLMKWKVKQYEKSRKKLVYTTYEDEKNIEEAMKLKLKPYIVL